MFAGSFFAGMCILGWSGWKYANAMGDNRLVGAASGFLSLLVPGAALLGTIAGLYNVSNRLSEYYGLKYILFIGYRAAEIDEVRARFADRELF